MCSECLLPLHLSTCPNAALYDSDLDDDEEEDDAEEDLEVHRLPDLLFRRPPQLLQYTAALHSPYGEDQEEEAQRGELTLVSHIGRKSVLTYMSG